MKRKPRKYQQRGHDFIYDNPESGLFLEPGLGKTGISLHLCKTLKENQEMKGALIIAPLRPCYLVWPKEIRKWDEFKDLSHTVLHGTQKDSHFDGPKKDLYIMNPDGLPWLLRKLHGRRVTSWPFDVLIIDESTKFKRTQSKRFKNLKKIAFKFKRRHILTGTPAPRGLMDLFGQFLIMNEGKTFGKEITKFKSRYFYKTGYQGFEYKLYDGAKERIHKLMAPWVIQMKAEDYLELPELIINPLYVELPKSTREQYEKMEKILRLDFEEGRVTAVNAGILSSKCRQIACGGIYLDGEDQKWKNLHFEKAKAVEDLIDEFQGNQALVAYEFRHDLDRLTQTLGNLPCIKGRMTISRMQEYEGKWNKGDIPVLLGQHTAIALGLNIQEGGNNLIIHTLPWSYETYYQLIRRLYRDGQKAKQVFVHVIMAKNCPVEQAVWKSLQGDEKTHLSLFDALKSYWGM